jgi:hypothetical protein
MGWRIKIMKTFRVHFNGEDSPIDVKADRVRFIGKGSVLELLEECMPTGALLKMGCLDVRVIGRFEGVKSFYALKDIVIDNPTIFLRGYKGL